MRSARCIARNTHDRMQPATLFVWGLRYVPTRETRQASETIVVKFFRRELCYPAYAEGCCVLETPHSIACSLPHSQVVAGISSKLSVDERSKNKGTSCNFLWRPKTLSYSRWRRRVGYDFVTPRIVLTAASKTEKTIQVRVLPSTTSFNTPTPTGEACGAMRYARTAKNAFGRHTYRTINSSSTRYHFLKV